MDALCHVQLNVKRVTNENENIKTKVMTMIRAIFGALLKKSGIEQENPKNWGGCPVCGMEEWCGTDGCPMDPQ